MQLTQIIFVLCLALVVVQATQVSKCEGTRKLDSNEVSISHCEKGTCKLRRKSTVHIEQVFKPEKDVPKLTTSVFAKILDVPLPFIGVDGTSACDNMFTEDGNTKVDCPLKAGETYLYKNSFKILDIYPRVNLVVHWALNNGKEDLSCFEVPAKIV